MKRAFAKKSRGSASQRSVNSKGVHLSWSNLLCLSPCDAHRCKFLSGKMRFICILAARAIGLVCVLACPAHAGVTYQCLENALPLELLSNDSEREALLLQAKTCMLERKPLRAVALLSQVIKSDPTDVGAYINRGNAKAAAGELGSAISDYSVAIRLEPDLAQAWYDRGTVLANVGRFESAIADFTEAIRLKPEFAAAYCNRGLARSELARYDDAIADYSVGVERDPREPYCRFNRGGLYLTLGYYQKAIDDLSEALAAKPNDPIALTKRGQAYELLGKINQASDDFRAALASRPELVAAKEGLARILDQRQQADHTSDQPPRSP
ncbi:tetratricopeptide repeat protein [Methyloceanibacter sp.]|uniref:tetratricopeptide repeat protein n=1 Tax=Methyloceanibacter sp. TaxID=1965321 RepID=UPI003D6D7356